MDVDNGVEAGEAAEEWAAPTPLRKSFATQLTPEEYEEQGRQATKHAILGLIHLIETNPEIYTRIVEKRQEEEDTGSVFGFLKNQFYSLFGGNSKVPIRSDL